jgi:hypothetical protein
VIPALWSTSGLADAEGHLERPTALDQWRIPEFVTVRGDRLVWHEGLGRASRSKRGLLEEFLGLADQTAERIQKYAQRWGVLGICEHGLPLTHNPPPRPLPAGSSTFTWCRPLPQEQGWYWEPIAAWHRYAQQMRAVLNIVARLHQGQLGSDRDWRVLYYKEDPVPWWKRVISADRSMVSVVVNEWLAFAGVRPVYSWDLGGKASIMMAGGSLFGALIVQLAIAIGRIDGLAVCSGCGVSYVPSRNPRSDQRRYCPVCRHRHVPVRDAAADYRRRQKRARSD